MKEIAFERAEHNPQRPHQISGQTELRVVYVHGQEDLQQCPRDWLARA